VEHHYVVNETGCGNGGLQAIRHALRWEVLRCEFGHGVGGCPTSGDPGRCRRPCSRQPGCNASSP